MKPPRLAALLFVSIALGCGGGGGGGGGGGSKVKGAVKVLNGPTSTTVAGARPATTPGLAGVVGTAVVDTTYRLSPATMKMTVTGVGLIPAGGSASDVHVTSLSGCTATYDRSKGSLAELSNCEVTAPTGTFDGVAVQYDPTFTVVVNDTEAGIYSDPAAPGGLTTAPPAGGAQPIQVRDQNQTSDFGQVTTFFPASITISEGSSPQLYVVFEPTHWMLANLSSGGSFSAPTMGGNPPIVPAMSSFGKAALYSNIGTTMSYPTNGRDQNNGMSLLFLYGDATTPVSVTWQDHTLCPTSGSAPVVAFNGNGTHWGTFGMLGLDAGANLAWASAAGFDQATGKIPGYSGVYKLPSRPAIEDTTTLQYRCTDTVPPPASGATYSSGAPDFTPDGSVSLTLVEN